MSDTGYKKPPKHSQFQKGLSGNSAGRPRGSKNTLKLLNDVLEQKITVTQDGKPINISKKLAMLMQLVNSAVKGDIKAISALFPYLLQIDIKDEEKEQAVQALSQTDSEIIEMFLKENTEKQETENGDE
jgi:hypothetical protein